MLMTQAWVAQRGLTRVRSGRESSRVMGNAGEAGGGPARNSRMASYVTDRGRRCVYTDTRFARPRRTCWGEPTFKKKMRSSDRGMWAEISGSTKKSQLYLL